MNSIWKILHWLFSVPGEYLTCLKSHRVLQNPNCLALWEVQFEKPGIIFSHNTQQVSGNLPAGYQGKLFSKKPSKALLEGGRGTLGFMGIEPTLISGLWDPYSHKALFQNPWN
jgi:hypothetical protein